MDDVFVKMNELVEASDRNNNIITLSHSAVDNEKNSNSVFL